MNRRQKLIQQQFLNNEKKIIRRLDQVYGQALKDVNGNIERLMKRFDPETGDLPQSAIYQLKYQNMVKDQLEGIMNELQTKQFTSVSEYLDTCYEDGFVGSLFDLHGQDVPLMMPLDQEAMVTAVQLDSKISKGLYTHLGEDVSMLKKRITAEVSRSIATGASFAATAKQLAGKTRIGYNNAIRIARTEGHRIQNQATMNVMEQAKDRGADVVKQWDATLDGKTRDSHAQVDGEIRELDEKFSNGLQFPGDPSGKAAEVINCRCATLQRARWAVGDGFTKWNNFTKRLETFDSPQDYGEFKKAFFSPENKRYMNYVQQMEENHGTKDFAKLLDKMTDREYKHFSLLFSKNPLFNLKARLEKIVKRDKIFVQAKTIEEAREFAKNTLGLATGYYYKDVNLNVANMINKSIQEVYDVFGNIHDAGYLTGIRIMTGHQSYVAAYSPPMKEILLLKKNVSFKNSLKNMAKKAEEQYSFGFWSTDRAEHTVRHEIGHAIEKWIAGNDATKMNKISVLRNQILQDCGIKAWSMDDTRENMLAAGQRLSYYGLRNNGEFIAESVAEYMTGKPRETAKKVVEILLEGM